MSVKITFKIPVEFYANLTVKRAMDNAANFVRDMWLSRAPHVTGEYAQGLLQDKSVIVRPGEITIQNVAKHAEWYEFGHRAFNIGLAILAKSKKARVSKEGFRYLPIRITKRGSAKFRAPSIQKNIKDAFKRTIPKGKIPTVSKYGAIAQYMPRKRLQVPLKAKPGTPGDVVTISEKAIRKDPTKWRVPAQPAKKLAEKVKKETEPMVLNMLRQALTGEQERQKQMHGKNPAWYKRSMKNKPIKKTTVAR